LTGVSLGAEQESRSRNARCDFFEQFNPFSANRRLEIGKSGQIAARPRETRNHTADNWVGQVNEHNRHRLCLPKQFCCQRCAVCDDDVGGVAKQFRRVGFGLVEVGTRPSNLDPNIVPRPSQLL
jgi:hypothetical protein